MQQEERGVTWQSHSNHIGATGREGEVAVTTSNPPSQREPNASKVKWPPVSTFARSAYCRVFRVSSKLYVAGDIAASITVTEFPPSDSLQEEQGCSRVRRIAMTWQRGGMQWDGMQWYGMGWNGMGWDGMQWDGMGWDGIGWYGMVWNGMGCSGMGWDAVEWNGME